MSIADIANSDASIEIPQLFPRQEIIDPRDDSIQVLCLRNGEYRDGVRSVSPDHAVSEILPGFSVDVNKPFGQARAEPFLCEGRVNCEETFQFASQKYLKHRVAEFAQ